jgi:uncharacterized protein YndB with AHSA1/START domain/DNA-binding transcriptional ArsR family regulator
VKIMDEDAEKIFKALADVSRRKLLDLLFQENGQTLSALQLHLPQMTRFGCMKHLEVLEKAGLVTTRKVGREKHHYLNAVPIQLIYDRWVSKYAQPWANTLIGLKNLLEDKPMADKHSHVFEVFIKTTPEKLWQALTDGSITPQYYMNTRLDSSWNVGAKYNYFMPDGTNMLEGEVLEIDPPRKLVTTFQPMWITEEQGSYVSKVTWEIQPLGAVCKLSLTHDDMQAGTPLTQGLISGWAEILSNLKTLLETGEPLVISK